MKTWEWLGDGARPRRDPGERGIRERVVERYGNGRTSATYANRARLDVARRAFERLSPEDADVIDGIACQLEANLNNVGYGEALALIAAVGRKINSVQESV